MDWEGVRKMAFLCHFYKVDARRGMAQGAVFGGPEGWGAGGRFWELFEIFITFSFILTQNIQCHMKLNFICI